MRWIGTSAMLWRHWCRIGSQSTARTPAGRQNIEMTELLPVENLSVFLGAAKVLDNSSFSIGTGDAEVQAALSIYEGAEHD
jgi:hypothetical protein